MYSTPVATHLVEAAILAASLGVASVQDLKRRMVDDRVWLVTWPIGIVVVLARLWRGDVRPSILAQQIFEFVPLGLLLLASWKLRLIGEADILAYLTVEIVQPTAQESILPPSFSTFIYSKLLLLFAPPIQFSINLVRVKRDPSLLEGFDEPLWRIALALALLSSKPELGSVPAESVQDGRKKFILSRIFAPLEPSKPHESCRWYVPAYPLMPLIFAGYLLSQVLGDPVSLLLRILGSESF
ncbi:MAG TPA: hypothetical protein ENG69_01960 [Candidatus Korarchaeota archaeon]|nr:hypothetical protein [Candidatus Korarchaeota archaeon]